MKVHNGLCSQILDPQPEYCAMQGLEIDLGNSWQVAAQSWNLLKLNRALLEPAGR